MLSLRIAYESITCHMRVTLTQFFSRPRVSLCDDDKSSFLLESDFVVDTSLINLEEGIDTSLTLLLLFTPSSLSIPRDTTDGILTLPISPLLIAQYTGSR